MSGITSTPIQNLPNRNVDDNQNPNENSQLINEILKELETDYQQNSQVKQVNPNELPPHNRMLPAMPPPPQHQQQMPPPPQHQQQMPPPPPQHQQQMPPPPPPQYQQPQEMYLQQEQNILNNVVDNDGMEKIANIDVGLQLTKDEDLNTLIVTELKRPMIIICLSIMFALPATNRSLLQMIPKLANAQGNLNLLGIILKAIITGLLYYVLDKCF
tara:strand:+ start:1204 stop:1845 length:642 start_codon:yes stop_codon:yes gene_type:complete